MALVISFTRPGIDSLDSVTALAGLGGEIAVVEKRCQFVFVAGVAVRANFFGGSIDVVVPRERNPGAVVAVVTTEHTRIPSDNVVQIGRVPRNGIVTTHLAHDAFIVAFNGGLLIDVDGSAPGKVYFEIPKHQVHVLF